MNRTALTIKMLNLIHSYGTIKKSELAILLETNERNIIEFKNQLELAGYYITSKSGRYGGYSLENDFIFPSPKLNDSETREFNRLSSYLRNNEHLNTEDLDSALTKIASTIENTSDIEEVIVKTKFDTIDSNTFKEYYTTLQTAIINNLKIILKYNTMRKTTRNIKDNITFHPYKLARVNDILYVVGYGEEQQEIKIYRLNRIYEMTLTKNKFWIDPNFKLTDYIDDNGFTTMGADTRIKLKVKNPTAKYLKESQEGSNVTITDFGDYIIYETTLRGDQVIEEYILKMASDCEVLEPIDIRNTIERKILEMNNIYSKL